jgi:intracellular septation protein A
MSNKFRKISAWMMIVVGWLTIILMFDEPSATIQNTIVNCVFGLALILNGQIRLDNVMKDDIKQCK